MNPMHQWSNTSKHNL